MAMENTDEPFIFTMVKIYLEVIQTVSHFLNEKKAKKNIAKEEELFLKAFHSIFWSCSYSMLPS